MIIPELLPEQERDANILASRSGAADWSEAGAAKTLTALRAVELRGGIKHAPLLIAASPIALRMWSRVAPAYFKTSSVKRIASSKDAIHLDHDITIVSYDLLARNQELVKALAKREYSAMICDEAHALVNLTAKRTTAIYGRRADQGGLIRRADFGLALTGTPIPRYADGLFPVLKALGRDVLQYLGCESEEAFLKRFTYREMRAYHPRQRPKLVVIRSVDKDSLSDAVFEPVTGHQFAVRRYVDELTDLPPVTFTDLEIDYVRSQELTEATARLEAEQALNVGRPDLFAEAQTVAAATVRHMLGVAKCPTAGPVLSELRASYHSPVLAFFWHTEVGRALYEMLAAQGFKVALIDGSTSVAKKNAYEDAWNEGKLDFLLGQIVSMGESLNLQEGGNVCAFVEHDWSKARHEQAYKRVLRFGQTKHVQVFNLYADHPADDAAASVAERKAMDAAAILDKRRNHA